MRLSLPLFLAPMAIALSLTSPGSASTVLLQLTGNAAATPASSFIQEDGVFANDTFTVRGSQEGLFTASTFAAGSVDAQTGQLRFLIEGSYSCEADSCGAGYSTSARTRVDETLSVTGTGTLTAVMAVNANWLAPRYNFAANLSLSSTTGGRDGDQVAYSYTTSPGGQVVNDLLMAEVSFTDAVNVGVNAFWSMQGDIAAAPSYAGRRDVGFMNAINTATFFVFASDGLTFEASNSGFLSNAAYLADPAPVPLPAGALLLLSAVGGLAVARRRVMR